MRKRILLNGCSTINEQIKPTKKPVETSPNVWCCKIIRAVPNTPAMRINKQSHATGLYPKSALNEINPPTIAPIPAMCSLSFHFKFTITHITIIKSAASIIPVIYHGMLSLCIMNKQRIYDTIVKKKGINLLFRSAKSVGENPFTLRKTKMVMVGINIVKQ